MFSFTGSRGSFRGDLNFYGKAVSYTSYLVPGEIITNITDSQFGLGVSMPASRSAGLGFNSCQ